MGKLSVDSWLSRVGITNPTANHNCNGVSKRQQPKTKKNKEKTTTVSSNNNDDHDDVHNSRRRTIGVMAFEVARLMSKAIHLWHSLSDDRILGLKADIFESEGVAKLISNGDRGFLLSLALSEFADSVRFLARSVSRLGSWCADPVLRRFDSVFFDLIKNGSDPYGLRYAGKKMERKVKKMERLVAATCNLYQELEVMAEMEQTLRRMRIQAGANPSRPSCTLVDFKHKVAWQKQDVKSLRETSLWNRTYDYTVRLLARSLFNIVARIERVFGLECRSNSNGVVEDGDGSGDRGLRGAGNSNGLSRCHSLGPFFEASDRTVGGQKLSGTILPLPPPRLHRNWKKNRWAVSSRSFNGCIVGVADSPVLPSCAPVDDPGFRAVPRALINEVEDAGEEVHLKSNAVNYRDLFESLQKPLKAPPSTLGAAALALHYANVIIVIEKLSASPHLIGPDARDDLYGMLPASIRAALRARLKSYAKNLNSSFYDPVLAAEWSDALSRILDWLAPLAHNMIRWQSERNFEHQHVVSSANVLLLQTLYFANQAKTEAAITELLVGLNYLWRFRRELNDEAILECARSRSLTAV